MLAHKPVLLEEMLYYLSPKDGNSYIDATFGGGGYSLRILESASCFLQAFDRDPEAKERSRFLTELYPNNFQLNNNNFSDIDKVVGEEPFYDGIVFDFGISSFQVDDPSRGFSFQKDGPLDMRMTKGEGLSAADVVNTFSEEDLHQIIRSYGEEKKASIIAKAIVKERSVSPFQSTSQLAGLIAKIVTKKKSIHPATLTFQALRIFVNNELMEINEALNRCITFLKTGARIVTVTFHSLEDRIVKNWFQKHKNLQPVGLKKALRIENLTHRSITPSQKEIFENPRSRSARLRAFLVKK